MKPIRLCRCAGLSAPLLLEGLRRQVFSRCGTQMGPQGVLGSGENGYLFTGSCGALLFFQGFGEQSHSFGGFREPCKKVKKKPSSLRKSLHYV